MQRTLAEARGVFRIGADGASPSNGDGAVMEEVVIDGKISLARIFLKYTLITWLIGHKSWVSNGIPEMP